MERREIISHLKNISPSNQLFSNLFSKTVNFTKFLLKTRVISTEWILYKKFREINHFIIKLSSTLISRNLHTYWLKFWFLWSTFLCDYPSLFHLHKVKNLESLSWIICHFIQCDKFVLFTLLLAVFALLVFNVFKFQLFVCLLTLIFVILWFSKSHGRGHFGIFQLFSV